MKAFKSWAGWIVALCLMSFTPGMKAQLYPGNGNAGYGTTGFGGNAGNGLNGGDGNYGGNTSLSVARVAVAPDPYTGIGGISHVTVPTRVVQRQYVVRQFFIAGGIRLNGRFQNGNNQGRQMVVFGP